LRFDLNLTCEFNYKITFEFYLTYRWSYLIQLIMSSKGKYAPPAAQKEEGGIPDEEGVEQKDFVVSKGLTSQEAAALLETWGRNELQEKSKAHVNKLHCIIYRHLQEPFF
jgi:hypothetical protein